MSSRIVIGDVHGCLKTLQALMAQFPPGVPVTFAGDLIDRGPNSAGVVQLVMDGNHHCVLGNHEVMFINYLTSNDPKRDTESDFARNGGLRTLWSYEHDHKRILEHSLWMASLQIYLEYPDCKRDDGRHLVVSHSAVGPVWKLRNDPTRAKLFVETILWERKRYKDVAGIYNIFGHTPEPDEPRIKSFYANIDTGAAFHRDFSSSYGRLTALQFPEMKVYTQEYCE